MAAKIGAVLEKPVAGVTCKHHWLIEPPDGPVSRGVCKVCGETKVFDNVLQDLLSSRDSVATVEADSAAPIRSEVIEDDEGSGVVAV